MTYICSYTFSMMHLSGMTCTGFVMNGLCTALTKNTSSSHCFKQNAATLESFLESYEAGTPAHGTVSL